MKWDGKELPPGKRDDSLGEPGGLRFVQVGTIEWSTLRGEAFGPVREAAVEVFHDAPGAVSRLDIEEKIVPDTVMRGFHGEEPRFLPRHASCSVSIEQPRLYVYRVERNGKALGLVFLNRGAKELGDIGE